MKFLVDVDSEKRKIKDIDSYMSNATTSIAKFDATLKTVATNMAIMLAVNLAIKGIAWVIDEVVVTSKELKEAATDASDELKNIESKVDSLNTELKTTKNRIAELEGQPSLSFIEQEELNKLKDASNELKRQIELNNALLSVAEGKSRDTALDYLNRQQSYEQYDKFDMSQVENGNEHYGKASYTLFTGNSVEIAKAQIEEYGLLLQKKSEIENKIDTFKLNNPDETQYTLEQQDALHNLNIELSSYENQLGYLKDALYENVPDLKSFKESLDPDFDQSLIDQINKVVDAYINLFNGDGKNATNKFDEIWNSKDFASIRKEIEKLSSEGKLDGDTLSSVEGYMQLLEATGKSADEVAEHINYLKDTGVDAGAALSKSFTKSEMISAINRMSEGFEELDKIFASISDKDPFDFKLLDDKNFTETFDIPALEKEYSSFIETVSSSPDDINACKDAFNNLVSAWIDSTGILDKVDEGNSKVTASMLKLMGVENADILVSQALAKRKAEIAWQNEKVHASTSEEIQALADECDVADEAKGAFYAYYVQKMIAETAIDSRGDIEALNKTVQALGIATDAWTKYYYIKNRIDEIDKGNITGKDEYGNTVSKDVLMAQYENIATTYLQEYQNDLKSLYSDVKYTSPKSNTSNSGSSSKKDPTSFDWMERRISVIDRQTDQLQDKIDNLIGYKNKNSNTDTAIDLMIEKMSILQQMHDRYMQEADNIGLGDEYISKVQNGLIDIDTISDEILAKKIKDYQEWYDKAQDTLQSITETKNRIKELNLSKLDNIISEFGDLLDIQSQILNTQEKIIDLKEQSGEGIFTDDYTELGERQLEIAQKNLDAYNALSSAMSKMNLEQGSEEWKKYNDQLQEYRNNMISAAQAVEDYKDKIADLVYKELDDFNKSLNAVNNTISTMSDLIGNTKLTDEFGNLNDRGLAQMALYAQQLANSKQEAAEYGKAILSLEDALSSGLITQDEYNERLYDYRSAQESAIKSTKEAKDAMLSLIKEGIEAQIDAKKKLTDETIAALEAEQDLHDYQNQISEKTKNITTLQKKIAALSNATTGNELAQRLQLEKELADAQKDLYETQYDHNIEQQKKALNESYEAYEKEKQDEMDELESNLDAQEAAIKKYLNEVKTNYSKVYDILTKYGDEYSLSAIEDLTSPWESGMDAANLCSDAIGDAIANINYEISNIDITPLQELIDALNSLSEYGIGGSVGSGSTRGFEDITGTGKWQKGKNGKWWYGDPYREDGNYDYASDGIYTINGKQYGFDDNGYMQTEWANHDGNYYYFDKDTGVMQTSRWIPGKNGEQYYLLADGTMAQDMAIRDKNGNGYYYVDNDGIWDGETLSYEDVKRLGYVTGYKNGTQNATPGLHKIDEEGAGSEIIVLKDGSIIRPFNGGESVFSKAMVDNLWDFAKNPNNFMNGFRNTNTIKIPENIKPTQNVVIQSTVNVEGSADEKTISRIQNVMHDEMVKFTKKELFNVIKLAGRNY